MVLVHTKVLLTLHPELIDPTVNLDGLQGHAEGRQGEDGDEEDLAGVLLEEVAQLAELILETRPDPQRRPLAVRLALFQRKHTSKCSVHGIYSHTRAYTTFFADDDDGYSVVVFASIGWPSFSSQLDLAAESDGGNLRRSLEPTCHIARYILSPQRATDRPTGHMGPNRQAVLLPSYARAREPMPTKLYHFIRSLLHLPKSKTRAEESSARARLICADTSFTAN